MAEEVKIKISIDASDVEKAAAGMRGIAAGATAAGSAFDEFNAAQAEALAETKKLVEEEKRLAAARDASNDPEQIKALNKALSEVQAKIAAQTEKVKAAGAAFAAATKNAAGATAETLGFGAAVETAAGSFGPLLDTAKKFGALVPSFKASGEGVVFFGKALRGLGGAIAASGIGALVLLLGSLVSYFTQTAEGGRKLKAIMTGLGEAFGQVMNVVQSFGKSVFEALSNPKKLITDLGALIRENLENRFKAVSVVMEGIRDFDFKKVANGVLQLGTGVENVTDKIGGAVNGVVEFGKNMVNVFKGASAAQERYLYLQEVTAVEVAATVARLKGQFDTLSVEADNAAFGFDERLKKLKEAEGVAESMFGQEIALLQEQLALKRQLNSYTDTSAESLAEEKQLEAELNAKIGERNTLMADLAKRVAELRAEQEAALEAERAAEAARVEGINAAAAALEARAAEIRKEMELGGMADEYAKKIAEINAALEAELASLSETMVGLEFKTAEERAKVEAAHQAAVAALREKAAAETADVERERAAEAARAAAEARLRELESGLLRERLELEQALADGVIDRRRYEALGLEITRSEIEKRLELVEKGSDEEAELLMRAAEVKKQIADKEVEDRRAAQDAIKDYAVETAGKMLEAITSVTRAITEANVAEYEKERDARLATLDEQLEKGLITQEKYNELRAAEEERAAKKIAEEKRKAAEVEKAVSLTQAVISTGLAVLQAYASMIGIPVVGPVLAPIAAGVAAAFGAVQIGLIAATPIPEFSEGVIDLSGPGTETSDDIPAFLSRGESVMTARETREYLPTLKAIRAGYPAAALNAAATGAWQMDVERLERAIKEVAAAVENKDAVRVNVDADGFAVWAENKSRRAKYLDGRYGLS